MLCSSRQPLAAQAVTEPAVNEDFVDIVSSFTEAGVVFLVVGAYALAAHGFPRNDWRYRSTGGAYGRQCNTGISRAAGVRCTGRGTRVSEEDFRKAGNVYQFGLPPRRIDVLTSISGVTFAEANEHAIEGKLGPVTVRFIGRAAMRRNKLAAARPKDLLDAELLEDPQE